MIKVSVKDKPIVSSSEDLLNVNKYASALIGFIQNSDTPMTIGLQGEWGTGKTSLMYILREELEKLNVATSWVNTWEYSIFREVKETTPAILNGLINTLQESCGENWTIKAQSEVAMKKIGRFFGNLINQLGTEHLGINIKEAAENNNEPSIKRTEISQVKKDIEEVIQILIDDPKNPYKRVVFFIDDLDRINPNDAVEVLEALKNIFDLNNCIFVIAIDYDVVVKGLEKKFGPKTEENEREFRSFFDKIIQVPFSMPIGSYDIDNFLDEKLKGFGFIIPESLRSIYMEVVKNTVGFNPRSLKRFLNTFSLLNSIRKLNLDDDIQNDEINNSEIELMLFALLGIQISYPKIFRQLSINPEFKSWDQSLASRNGLDWIIINEKVRDFGENELVDEEWEKVIWGFCQSDSYLKSRVFSILDLLNKLLVHFGIEKISDIMQDAMEFASITAVDDNQDSKQAVRKVGNKTLYSGIDSKIESFKNSGANKDAIEAWIEVWNLIDLNKNKIKASINYAATATTIKINNNLKSYFYCKNPAKKSPGMRFWISWGEQHTHNDLREILNVLKINISNEIVFGKNGDTAIEIPLSNLIGSDLYKKFLLAITEKFIERNTV